MNNFWRESDYCFLLTMSSPTHKKRNLHVDQNDARANIFSLYCLHVFRPGHNNYSKTNDGDLKLNSCSLSFLIMVVSNAHLYEISFSKKQDWKQVLINDMIRSELIKKQPSHGSVKMYTCMKCPFLKSRLESFGLQ